MLYNRVARAEGYYYACDHWISMYQNNHWWGHLNMVGGLDM